MTFKLKELHCFLEVNEDGSETIIQSGRADPDTKQIFVMPLITGSEKMAAKMVPIAQLHANETHRKVAHVKLTNREDLETIEEQLIQSAGPSI